MRRIASPALVLLVALVLPAAASAATRNDLKTTGEYGIKQIVDAALVPADPPNPDNEPDYSGEPTWNISWGDGCMPGEDTTPCSTRFSVRKGERTILNVIDDGQGLGDARDLGQNYNILVYERDWSCSRAGHYTWTVNTRASNANGSNAKHIVRHGRFKIPRCRPRLTRKIDRDTAVGAVVENLSTYRSDVTCRTARGKRAVRWTCRVVQIEDVQRCTRSTQAYGFRTDKYGEHDPDYGIRHTTKQRCVPVTS